MIIDLENDINFDKVPCTTLFNGVNISELCYFADDEKGIVKCRLVGFDGKFLIDNNDKAISCTLTGEVEIKDTYEKPECDVEDKKNVVS